MNCNHICVVVIDSEPWDGHLIPVSTMGHSIPRGRRGKYKHIPSECRLATCHHHRRETTEG